MSKQIKQLEMEALQKTFHDVSDMVVLSSEKLSCQGDHQFRTALRKKNIRLLMVKNSLARRVFGDLGIKVEGYLAMRRGNCLSFHELDLSRNVSLGGLPGFGT